MQMVTHNAANVVWQANFWVPKIPLKVMRKKTGIFGPKTPFSYISALFGPFHGPFDPFLTLFDTHFSPVG